MTGVGLAMNTSRIYAFIVLFIMIACGLIFFSGSGLRAKSSETLVPTKGDPIRIGILMPQAGALAEVAGVQAEGIKMANEMEKGKAGRQVELIFKDAGTSFQDFSQALKDLLMEDKVSGVISCVSADMIAKAFYVMKQRVVPFIATTSVGLDWKT
jgi:ABC-type branched-subunit amino acid transport system substrate-binding protein